MKRIRIPLKQIAFLLALMSLLLACDVSTLAPSPTTPPAPATDVPATAAPYSTWLQLYFTSPSAPASKNHEGGPDAALAKAIDAARLSVDVAA